MKLTPFSFVVLVLVGEGGAGPHDLVRMMRNGRIYWTAPESQYYAEPKRLAEAGYLTASKAPGRTHDRTHYTLTDEGRDALRGWLASPVKFARIQNEAVVRLLGAEFGDRADVLQSLDAFEHELDDLDQSMREAEEREATIPHRSKVLRLNRRLAQRLIDAHREWLDEVRREL